MVYVVKKDLIATCFLHVWNIYAALYRISSNKYAVQTKK